jgi:outer membrane murein-binding lipoprotein Lpp
MSDTHDFNDGNGPVPAHRHSNGGGWVADTAKVDESAYVGSDAQVYGYAQVSSGACVFGNAQIYGSAKVCGDAMIYGNDNAAKIAELTRKLDALRNEVKAARILGDASPLALEFARKQWEDAKDVTDTLNALEDER